MHPWGKFKELGLILTARRASLKVKGKVYRVCVQRVLVYGSETWPVKVEDIHRLERMMVRWMCGVSLKSGCRSDELRKRLGVESVSDIMRRSRLWWFGHLERKEESDWASSCRNISIDGKWR